MYLWLSFQPHRLHASRMKVLGYNTRIYVHVANESMYTSCCCSSSTAIGNGSNNAVVPGLNPRSESLQDFSIPIPSLSSYLRSPCMNVWICHSTIQREIWWSFWFGKFAQNAKFKTAKHCSILHYMCMRSVLVVAKCKIANTFRFAKFNAHQIFLLNSIFSLPSF